MKVVPGFPCRSGGTGEAAGEADWLPALKQKSVIGPLASQSRPGVQRVEEAAPELGLARSVVYDLLKRYQLRPQTSSPLPGKRGREPKLPILWQDRDIVDGEPDLFSLLDTHFLEQRA